MWLVGHNRGAAVEAVMTRVFKKLNYNYFLNTLIRSAAVIFECSAWSTEILDLPWGLGSVLVLCLLSVTNKFATCYKTCMYFIRTNRKYGKVWVCVCGSVSHQALALLAVFCPGVSTGVRDQAVLMQTLGAEARVTLRTAEQIDGGIFTITHHTPAHHLPHLRTNSHYSSIYTLTKLACTRLHL